jgi:thiol-disulfide isomerase/thioredoxin
MNAQFLLEKFSAALPYDSYVRSGSDEQLRRWKQVYDAALLKDPQRTLISQFIRPMNVLVISGIWCGDCVQQCPLMQRIAEANNDKISLRFLDRDQHKDLSDQCRLNAGDRVPIALFLAEDGELCSMYGERTLSRYRAIASRQLGAACEIAIVPPGHEEIAQTLADWLNEFERIQLMLRLSPRWRQKYAD